MQGCFHLKFHFVFLPWNALENARIPKLLISAAMNFAHLSITLPLPIPFMASLSPFMMLKKFCGVTSFKFGSKKSQIGGRLLQNNAIASQLAANLLFVHPNMYGRLVHLNLHVIVVALTYVHHPLYM